MIDLDKLNPPQREAVRCTEGPLLVLAGAGSGKTRVLTYRIAHLLEMGVPAWSILAITFTNKAAREMRDRIDGLVGDAARESWILTFHACCARMLRRDIEKIGYSSALVIYDEDDRMAVIKQIIKEKNLDDKAFPPKLVKSILSDAKNHMLSPADWWAASGRHSRDTTLREIYEAYEQQLRKNNALDFDDLLLKTLDVLNQHPDVLEHYRKKFAYLLVDEYQDTNMAQYQLIHLLSGARQNVCVVGDDDQSIYGWRGADLRNILEFEKDYPNCTTIKLEQNYRSTATILEAANGVIAHNTGRKEKALWTEADQGEKIRLYRALDERDEAAWIADQITMLNRQGMGAGDIAILYRTNAQSRVLEETLVRRGLQYVVYGGQKFYERKEVKDAIAYLRVLVDPDDDVSVRRIINEPKRAIGDATITALADYAAAEKISLMSAVMDAAGAGLTGRAEVAVQGFAQLMVDLAESLLTRAPADFMDELMAQTGLLKQYEDKTDSESMARAENLRELLGAVAEYGRQNPEESIVGFLENVALVTDMDRSEARQAITLMTLHSAKGLEFKGVFLAGLEEGIFPTTRALSEEEAMQEERRLMYVGITRAMRRLFISCARKRALYNKQQLSQPSRFLDEMPYHLVEDVRNAVRPSPTRLPSATARPSGYGDGRARESYRFSGAMGPRGDGAGTADPKVPEGGRLGAPRAAHIPPWADREPEPSGDAALRIPGVHKGLEMPSASSTPARLFVPGDLVMHRTLGRGRVVDVRTTPNGERVVIEFEGRGQKIFPAATAPVVRVEG